MHSKKKGPKINKYITSSIVRLIDADSNMLGILSLEKALEHAKEVNLDLVEVNPNSVPPVCKILDYGKIRYDKQKQVHKARKKQNLNIIKEIKIRPNIGKNDYSIKIKSIISFLEDRYRVKISLRFRGREMIFQDDGMEILNKIVRETEELANVESKPSKNNNQLIMILCAK